MTPLLFVLWLGACLHQESEAAVFQYNIEVHTVYADVFVRRDGRLVTGLTEDDFEVLDNGVPQEVELINHQDWPLAAILLLDVSGSVLGDRLDHLRAAAHAFVERLGPEDEVGLLSFTRELQLRLRLSHDFESLHRVLEQPMTSGETSLYDALYAGLKLVEGRAARPLVVLLTDGLDNMSWLTGSEVLNVVKASEGVVYAVAFKPAISITLRNGGRFAGRTTEFSAPDFLQNLISLSGGRVWYLDSGADLKDAFLSILNEMQGRYLMGYQPQGVTLSGWHSLKIRVRGGQADEVRARPGYFASSPQR